MSLDLIPVARPSLHGSTTLEYQHPEMNNKGVEKKKKEKGYLQSVTFVLLIIMD